MNDYYRENDDVLMEFDVAKLKVWLKKERDKFNKRLRARSKQ